LPGLGRTVIQHGVEIENQAARQEWSYFACPIILPDQGRASEAGRGASILQSVVACFHVHAFLKLRILTPFAVVIYHDSEPSNIK